MYLLLPAFNGSMLVWRRKYPRTDDDYDGGKAIQNAVALLPACRHCVHFPYTEQPAATRTQRLYKYTASWLVFLLGCVTLE